MDLVKFDNGLVTASSKKIADKFGKAHRDVLRAIKQLECSDDFRERNFTQSYYTSPQNKKLKCYDITRDGFSFLGMGFTGKRAGMWKESYINAFNSMEKNLDTSGSMMEKINAAIGLMEKDKKTASLCSRGLNEWKKIKKGHEKEVNRLVDESQLVLSLRII